VGAVIQVTREKRPGSALWLAFSANFSVGIASVFRVGVYRCRIPVGTLTRISHHEASQGIDPLIHGLIEPLKTAILFFN
jgi:hypothetical protein